MATRHKIYELSSSEATLVSPVGVHGGVDITIQNLSSEEYIYIGGEGVTTSSFGYRIEPRSSWSVELSGKDSIYAATDVNGTEAAVMMLSLESGS
jgi:hypothetical protein